MPKYSLSPISTTIVKSSEKLSLTEIIRWKICNFRQESKKKYILRIQTINVDNDILFRNKDKMISHKKRVTIPAGTEYSAQHFPSHSYIHRYLCAVVTIEKKKKSGYLRKRERKCKILFAINLHIKIRFKRWLNS